MTTLDTINESLFESIRHINEDGQEYWTARELQHVLDYTEWRKFKTTISRAMEACKASGNDIADHFGGAAKMVTIPIPHQRIDAYDLKQPSATIRKPAHTIRLGRRAICT